MKKIILFSFAMLIIASMSVYAQVDMEKSLKTPGFRGGISVHTNLDPATVYNFKSFGTFVKGINSMKDVGMAIPSMGVGLNGGYTGRWITIELNGRANFGTALVKGVKPQEKMDAMVYADFGIRLLKLWIMEVEVNGGFGACFPNLGGGKSGTTSTPSEIPSITYYNKTHMIVPVSAIIWFGGVRRARYRVGLSLEYILRLGTFSALPSSPVDAMGDVVNQVKGAPATINASLRYQF